MRDLRSEKRSGHLAIMVGAGPAALYATAKLAEQGHTVLILNRDIKPGGLAEYGIYPTKHKMKEGLRKQFRKILAQPTVHYFGNAPVRKKTPLHLADLQGLQVSAIVVAAGAQGTKWLGLPGEQGPGVYHAKDLVYHYNRLPPFSEQDFPMGERVAVIGIGNVMVDIAHYLINVRQVKEVIAIARRGPQERAYDDREMRAVAWNIDREMLQQELERVRPRLEEHGQEVEALYRELTKDCTVPPEDGESPTRLTLRFLSSPKRILRDAQGQVVALEVEETRLVARNGGLSAKGLGEYTQIPVDTVIFAIGDRVDPDLGLPVSDGGYATNPNRSPQDPETAKYQVYDPETGQPVEGCFVIGWSRSASEGVVGKARLDGEKGAAVVNRYLAHRPRSSVREIHARIGAIYHRLRQGQVPVVHKGLWRILEVVEAEEARRTGDPEFKFASNAEMLQAIEARLAQYTAARARRLPIPPEAHLLQCMHLYARCFPDGEGLTPEELALRTGLEREQFPTLLAATEGRGIVEQVRGGKVRWRLKKWS
ncbi:MAG: FAD-dependent oxidoreductase [Candidatus Methylomirabilales bacterium]